MIGSRGHFLWNHLGTYVTKFCIIRNCIPNQPDVFLDPTLPLWVCPESNHMLIVSSFSYLLILLRDIRQVNLHQLLFTKKCKWYKNGAPWAAPVAQRFSVTFSPGCDPGDPAWNLLLPLPVSLPLSLNLCLSLVNK